jgi:hypothetical protein
VTINNTGAALSTGNYTVISTGVAGSVAGSAPSAVTVSGSGLATGATASLQISGGQLNLIVSGGTPTQPHITNISLSGTSLVITGTNAPSGNQYNILTSTNLLLPLSQWTVLPTNTFGGSSFSITNTVNPLFPRSFYLIRMP